MPRESGRNFPDVAQLAISGTTLLGQSRITFSGAEGLVSVIYKVQLINAGAVAIPEVSLVLSGSVTFAQNFQGQAHSEAVAGRFMSVEAMALFRNPTPGSFVEASIQNLAGTVDVNANAGAMVVLSWETQDLGGPVVNVA